MTPKKKKILMISVPIIIIICIFIVFLILYLMTDFLKPNQTLFFKYISQNFDCFKLVTDNSSEKKNTNLMKQNPYESDLNISASYTEKVDTSEENKKHDINKIKVNIKNQSEYLNNYQYKDIKINYGDKNVLRTEYIHDGEIYGIRFPGKFKQFFTVENHDLKEVAGNTGILDNAIEIIPDNIEEFDFNSLFSFTDEELATLQERYLKIISDNISKDKFSKQRNALITVNEKSFETTAYSISVSEEEMNNLYVKILEQIKTDDIILNKISQFENYAYIANSIKDKKLSTDYNFLEDKFIKMIDDTIEQIIQNNIGTGTVKLSVYVLNGNTIRTQLIQDAKQVVIDLDTDDKKTEIHIQDRTANQEKEIERNIVVKREINENEIDVSFEVKNINGDNETSFKIYKTQKTEENSIISQTGFEQHNADTLLEIKIDEDVELNKTFETRVTLNGENSVVLNNYNKETISQWMKYATDYLNAIKTEHAAIITNLSKIRLIGKVIGPEKQEIPTDTTEVEKNRFNAKFDFYAGKEKTYEDVIKLIDETKDCLENVQVSYKTEEGATPAQDKKILQKVELKIKEGTPNDAKAESTKEMMEENRKYTIDINKSNNMVEKIIITVNE